ncbi:uncharacterized protein N7459_004103 [Penicillium hispanicum]|uniref:uncharacterized protein n=1 Tax=Penicillium hispanicum TaxID=1080232 RepID=UPI002540EC80|nr:uncharacterized protein N7459_004103 [Penicillium hispanicum]KAJ5584303.1 hypothetical protein N7459_004103 [Penicillium hispanicum]
MNVLALFGLILSLWISLSHAFPLQGATSQLQPRDDSWWWELVKKGEDWDRAMTTDEAQAGQFLKAGTLVTSPFTEYSSLARWGWVQSKPKDKTVDILASIFTELGIDRSNNQLISWEQAKDVTNEEKQLVPASTAEYINYFNTVDAAIIADMNISPQEIAGDCGELLPDLQKWSDVVFLQWQGLYQTANKPLEAPKYVIQKGVANSATKQAARKALGKGADFDDWSEIKDGKTFRQGEDEYWALLASPLGRGSAWFLTQHKPQFGLMTVSEITLWGGQGKSEWTLNMVSTIESV